MHVNSDDNNITNERDCLQRAWVNTTELVRDFEMYSKRVDDKRVANVFKNFAEEQGRQANQLRELFNEYNGTQRS